VTDLPENAKKVFAWTAGVILLFGTLFGFIKYVVHSETSELRTAVAQLETKVASLEDDVKKNQEALSKTNDKIDQLLSKALDGAFPSARGAKPTRGALEKAEKIISLAKVIDVKIDRAVLAKYGTAVAQLSEDPSLGPIAWSSLKQAIDYQSFLNKDFVPTPNSLTPWPNTGQYQTSLSLLPNPSFPNTHASLHVFYAGGYVKPEDSARMELLSKAQKASSKIGLLVVEGGVDGIALDGMYMKNVMVRNAHVIYNGGPVRLENITFVNCTFDFTKSKPTIDLGNTILQATSVNFSTVSPA
jgi:outer membrane murein-binding lipoprotein Lpp